MAREGRRKVNSAAWRPTLSYASLLMRPGTVRVPAGARATRVQALVPAWAPTKRHGHGKSIVGRCNATHSVLYSSSSNSHSAHRGVDIFVRPVLYGQNAEDPAPPDRLSHSVRARTSRAPDWQTHTSGRHIGRPSVTTPKNLRTHKAGACTHACTYPTPPNDSQISSPHPAGLITVDRI